MTHPRELLVAPSDAGPRVLWTDAAGPRNGRPISSVIRGKARLDATNKVVERCLVTGDREQHGEWSGTPIAHPHNGQAIAVRLREGGDTAVPDDPAVWVWELPPTPGPPRLYLSKSAHDFFGTDVVLRDRTIYGPADFFTRAPQLSEAIRHVDWLLDTDGDRSPSYHTVTSQVGDDGVGRTVELVECRLPGSKEVIGMGWDGAAGDDAVQGIDVRFADQVATSQSRHIAVLDVRFPGAVYVLRWVGGVLPGIGQGLSTGQSSGIHEDDIPAVARMVIDASQRTGGYSPVSTEKVRVRIRTTEGDFQPHKFSAWFLDAENAPGIVAVDVARDV